MEEKKELKDIERSLIKTYRKGIWVKFIRAINEYKMIEDGDKIAVAISGGKDSLTLAKLFQELKKHGKMKFDLEFIAMDPGYKEENRKVLEENCEYLGIPVKIHNSDIFEVANRIAENSPCYMCARMRRGNLYAKAQELGCNKLALGHHFNDVIETIMLNVLFAGNFKTMMPKLHSDNFEGLELIRPMYYVEEEAIIRFIKSTGLQALDCACSVAEKKEGSMRFYVKDLIKDIKSFHNNADINILRSAENINMGAVVGWKEAKVKHSFLENYKRGRGSSMKLISWNVNGLRSTIKKGFVDIFNELDADVFALQEIKMQEGQLDLEFDGYEAYYNYAERKGYSGTAVFTRKKPLNVSYGIGMEDHDNEGRVITLEFNDFYFITCYTPNSKRGLERLEYRMTWEDEFRAYLNKLNEDKPIVLCGDLNVAHKEIDLANPGANHRSAGFSDEEREKFSVLLEDGYLDTFRYFYPDKKDEYSWWSNFAKSRERNVGWRIDYFVVSERLKDRLVDSKIHQEVMGSDHCPIELIIK